MPGSVAASARRLRVALVGPGRVGSALGRRLAEAGCDVLGFVGRTAQSVARAVAFCGEGRPLMVPDLAEANVVLLAVGDDALPGVVGELASGVGSGPRLWLHTSGRFGLDVLDPLAGSGQRLAAVHPVTPFADAAAGYERVLGCPALVEAGPGAGPLATRIARLAGMRVVVGAAGDRVLYHAACALAANGLTALRLVAEQVLVSSGMVAGDAGAQLVDALMSSALAECMARGSRDALSGPLVRGDAVTVAAHLRSLTARSVAGSEVDAAGVYRLLMLAGLSLARHRGLDAGAADALRDLLAQSSDPAQEGD